MDDDDYFYGSAGSETPETVEGTMLDPFVVTETRDPGDTGDDYTPTEPGLWDDFWGPDSWDEDQPGDFWDSLVTAFDSGAASALANIKKALTPAQAAAAAAGKPSGSSSSGSSGSSSSSKPNQTTTTTNNTTNNFLTSPVAVIAMIFGGIYLLKIARK